jgi:hypothetical protein
MNVLELIKSSLRLVGAIASSETPASDMAVDAREALNLLLAEWHNNGLVSLTERQTFDVTGDVHEYAIGPGQTWDGNTPLKILSAYLTLGTYDYPLAIIGESEYMHLFDKSVKARPTKLCYVAGTGTGIAYLHGSPDTDYTITILNQKAFVEYTNNTTEINLPNGYLQALRYSLALELLPEYPNVPQNIVGIIMSRAQEAVGAIKKTNLKRPRQMTAGASFTGNSDNGGTYDIDSDAFL